MDYLVALEAMTRYLGVPSPGLERRDREGTNVVWFGWVVEGKLAYYLCTGVGRTELSKRQCITLDRLDENNNSSEVELFVWYLESLTHLDEAFFKRGIQQALILESA